MRTSLLLLGVLAVGCGNVRSPENPGDPLYTLQVLTRGETPPTVQGDARARLVWSFMGDGPLTDCLNQNPGSSGVTCLGLVPNVTESGADVPVQPGFPGTFQIPLHTLPPAPASSSGQTLAFARVVLYDDRNANQVLDKVSFSDSAPIDVVLGTSVEWREQSGTYLVFRSGALHPVWRVFEGLYGCPEPAPGYSVVSIDATTGVKCTLSPTEPVTVTFGRAQDRGEVCEGTPSWTPAASSYPSSAPPSDAVVTCDADGAGLEFYREGGRYCDPVVRQRYALEGCVDSTKPCVHTPGYAGYYDLRSAVPSWWPCPYTSVCTPGSGSFNGSYTSGSNAPVTVQTALHGTGRGVSGGEEYVRAIAKFGPADSELTLTLDLYRTVLSGSPVQAGTTYSFGTSDRPVSVRVNREKPTGGTRYWTSVEGTATVHAWNPQACGTNVVQVSGIELPADDLFEAMSIEGTFSFSAPKE